ALGRQPYRPRPAAHVEVALWRALEPLPFQEDRLRAALAAHHAHGLALHNLALRVDAGARPIAQAIADYLRDMPQELVVRLQAVGSDTDVGSVVGHADQEITALGVQERGDRLEHSVRHAPVVLPVFLEVPAQRGLELQRLRLALLDQL